MKSENKWENKELTKDELKAYVSENYTAADFYIELYNKAVELSGSAEPKDINAAIELIAQLGEARQSVRAKENQEMFNERSMEALTKAA